MSKIYSVRILSESTHLPKTDGSFFEDAIVMVKADSEENARKKVTNYYQPESYNNAEGGITTVTLVHIFDVYEVMEDFNDKDIDFKEVYSQFLIFEDKKVSLDDIIKNYNNLYGY